MELGNSKLWTIIVLISLFFTVRAIWMNIKFSNAVSSPKKTEINVMSNPVQVNLAVKKPFKYKSLKNSFEFTLTPMAKYMLSGVALCTESFLFGGEFLDYAALYDIMLAWGNASKPEVLSNIDVRHSSTRLVNWSCSPCPDITYFKTHSSNSHVIPANKNVMSALLTIKKYQKVRLLGYLVDLKFEQNGRLLLDYKTSLTRLDTLQFGHRGNGDCELFYVQSVQIEDKLYR